MSEVSPKDDPFNVEYWKKRWEDGRSGWHRSAVNPALLKYFGIVTGQPDNQPESLPSNSTQFLENSKKKWFLPLCGKTVDIPYLLNLGFRVFGVEAVKMSIEELNAEHSLNLKYDEASQVYTGADGRLEIYCGDLFRCPIEKFGPVDYIWDRGSFIAVEYPFREKYIETVQRVLKRPDGSWYDFRYLLEIVTYDKSKYGGPPRSADEEDMKKYFASWSNVEFLESEHLYDGHPLFKDVGEGGAFASYFLMTPSK